MRAAAVHLCFIDSGHPSLNRCQVMRHALSKQGYDRKAPVDLQLIRSSGATIARPTCRWFRSPKKKEPLFSQARAPFFRPVRLASENNDVLTGQ